MIVRFFCLFAGLSLYADSLVDLEANPQNFVLETKRITISDYPFAFNPSFIEVEGNILMSFRILPGNKKTFNSEIGLVWLNQEFDPISPPQLLTLRDPHSSVPCRAEDGRLIQIGRRLYIVYSDCLDAKVSKKGFRVQVAELIHDGNEFHAINRDALTQFQGETPNLREKNWVPFDYNGYLILAYSLNPHLIFQPYLGTGSCETVAITQADIDWRWGRLSGGTPAIKIDDQYLSIFHSWIDMESLQSNGEKMSHYFMGAYTFSSNPPFELKQISPEPIVAKGFYSGENHPYYWKPVQAVFPCGLIARGEHLWIAYGRQDHEMWVMKVDKQKLLSSLVPVKK